MSEFSSVVVREERKERGEPWRGEEGERGTSERGGGREGNLGEGRREREGNLGEGRRERGEPQKGEGKDPSIQCAHAT